MGKKLDSSWQIFSLVNDWVKFADGKASIVLAANGVVAGVFFSNMQAILELAGKPLGMFLLVTALSSFAISVYYSLKCVLPQLGDDRPPSSLLYFGHIARFQPSEYKRKLKAMLGNEAAYEEQLASQIWQNADIASKKFRWIAIAIWSLLVSLTHGSVLSLMFWMGK